MKMELFGNAEADMSIYKKNDKEWLDKAHKIAKVLELEELLEFYQKNHKTPQNKVEAKTNNRSNNVNTMESAHYLNPNKKNWK